MGPAVLYSEKIIDALVGIVLNQIHHPLKNLVSAIISSLAGDTDVGHNRLALGIFDIAEWHLSPLVFVDADLRVVHIGDLLEGDYQGGQLSESRPIIASASISLTSLMHHHASYPHSRISRHLLRTQSSANVALFPQFGGPI